MVWLNWALLARGTAILSQMRRLVSSWDNTHTSLAGQAIFLSIGHVTLISWTMTKCSPLRFWALACMKKIIAANLEWDTRTLRSNMIPTSLDSFIGISRWKWRIYLWRETYTWQGWPKNLRSTRAASRRCRYPTSATYSQYWGKISSKLRRNHKVDFFLPTQSWQGHYQQ